MLHVNCGGGASLASFGLGFTVRVETAVEDQASDRVWRIGQTRGVVVHTLVCPGTLEERIADLLDQKRTLAESVVASSPEKMISELDDAALAALVELDTERAREMA